MRLPSDDNLDAFILAYKYTSQIDKDLMPTIKLQSMCAKANYGAKLNLYKLSSQFSETARRLELELFPALTITKYKPVSVNVFASGNIILFGIKDIRHIDDILHDLYPLLCNCVY